MNVFIFWLNIIAFFCVLLRLSRLAVHAINKQVYMDDADILFFGVSLCIFVFTTVVSLFMNMTWVMHMRLIVFGIVMSFICGVVLHGDAKNQEETLLMFQRQFVTALIGVSTLALFCFV